MEQPRTQFFGHLAQERPHKGTTSSKTFSPRWSTCRKPLFQVNNHDRDVIKRTSLVRGQRKASSTTVRLMQMALYEWTSFVIVEHVPETICSKDYKMRTDVNKVKGKHIRVCDDDVILFQRVVAKSSWHGKYADDTPDAVEHDETSRIHNPLSLILLQKTITTDTDYGKASKTLVVNVNSMSTCIVQYCTVHSKHQSHQSWWLWGLNRAHCCSVRSDAAIKDGITKKQFGMCQMSKSCCWHLSAYIFFLTIFQQTDPIYHLSDHN